MKSCVFRLPRSCHTNYLARRYRPQRSYEANADYAKAIELDPSGAEHWFKRAYTYSKMKEWDKAEGDYTRAIELDHIAGFLRYLLKLRHGYGIIGFELLRSV